MKKRIFCLMMFMMVLSVANAQKLVLQSRGNLHWSTDLTMKNKPNGYIYRLRVDKQCDDLPNVPETEGLELFIAEPIDLGWLGFYRLPTSADKYDFVVVIYNHDKKPLMTVNLCDVSNNRYCEVQDVRWDADTHNLLFNMACPSYSSSIGGKGSKLHCYNPEQRRMVWETGWLTSNDIFILDEDFVYCSYGFTDEKDYMFLLDKQTGKVLSKILTLSAIQYMELKEINGKKQLYALDYNEKLYIFNVVKGQTVGKQGPDVFTVVYATSDDNFMNVRSQPSMKGTVVEKVYGLMHGLGNGVLREKGQSWSKVSVGNVTGWVYNKYLGYQNWYRGKGQPKLIAGRDDMPIYGENYEDGSNYTLFTTVKKGTIIADEYDEIEGYYVLITAHDYLFVKKQDVEIKK